VPLAVDNWPIKLVQVYAPKKPFLPEIHVKYVYKENHKITKNCIAPHLPARLEPLR
jgi:hypothetical protein